ncbi:MAG: polyphenol oxidase family protein [Candidatus Adiutrix sp.]|jgi:YfiH family protein|nr:polyphenol oxidase family protein [Candidatus Adiutrix sp.]
MLLSCTHSGLSWYEFPGLAAHPELRHGVFTRRGGASGPEGRELSLAFNEIDPPENVVANLGRAEAALGLPRAAFVRQTHGAEILVVETRDDYHPRSSEEARPGYDALLAPAPGPALLVKVADCQAVLLYDPVSRALALAHSGWRGSVQNILGRVVAAMAEIGVPPARMKAAISPSLGPCCAEFTNHRTELPPEFQPFMIRENHFDFWAISRSQLTAAGLKEENIETAGICTRCSPEFYSYRRGDLWPRFGFLAGVRPPEETGI